MLALLATVPLPAAGQDRWVKLSDGKSFSDVQDFIVGPDGDRVMFVHDADFDEAFELWSVAMTGGTPVRLSGLLPSGSRVFLYRFTPNGLLTRKLPTPGNVVMPFSLSDAPPVIGTRRWRAALK